jgi:cytochrome c peroxidase
MPRSAPSLWNVAFLRRFFWDARSDSLEAQMLGPLYDENEMATSPAQLLRTLNGIPLYRALFAQAFPLDFRAPDTPIRLDQVYTAITAFELSLISLNSRYDQYAHGYADALTEPEKKGLNVFRSFVARCAECHTPPLFTNQQLAVIGTPEPEGMPFDSGAELPLGEPSLRGGFKVPSLRNIALTAPYMHSGRFATLREATAFYTQGRGHAVPEGEDLKIHWHIWEPNLGDEELDRLVDFLGTLTDESFKPVTPQRLPSGLSPVHNKIALRVDKLHDGASTDE